MRRFVATMILSVAALCPAASSQPRPAAPAQSAARLTIEDVLRWRLPAEPAISPDGRRVAFLLLENNFEKSQAVAQLWWVDVESRQARRLTHAGESVASPQWSPDGRWLAFLSARESQDSQKPQGQVYLLPVEGGEASALTRAPRGVDTFRWSHDGKSIFYIAREARSAAGQLDEDRRKQKLDAVVVDADRLRREIWRMAVDGAQAERVFAGDLGVNEILPSPDGRWLLYRTNLTGDPDHETKNDLWLLDLTTRATRRLTARNGEERMPVWSPDSMRIAFVAPRTADIRYSQEEIFAVPVAAIPPRGADAAVPEPQRITNDFSGAIERLRWPLKSASLIFSAAVRTGSQLFSLDPADGRARALSNASLFLTAPDCAPDATACVALLESATALPDVALLRPPDALVEPQKITDLNPQLRNFALGPHEVVRWKSRDGTEIEGLLIKPPRWQPGEKYPLLLDIHGGPYSRRGNTLTFGHWPQVWAARGWLVLQPNFRGSAGYGNDFGLANRGDIAGKDVQDVLSGVDFAIAQHSADPERLAVIGESYGGYLTNWLISQSDRFRGAVSMFGIFNLITDFSNSDFPSWETDYLKDFYWDNLALYLDRSPMKYVKQIRTPVLILHGDDDNNTFISNSKEMYQALKALGRTVKFVRFPREGHGFLEPNHLLEQYRQMAAWLDEHVLRDARARAAHEAVRAGGWELRVAAVRNAENYAGVAPKGKFLEVELLIRAVEPSAERFNLFLFDTAGSEVSLSSGPQNFFPEGVVAESLGQRLLIKSSAQSVAAVPDKNGNHDAIAVALAFDVPRNVQEFTLRVKDFPPLRIELPLP